MTRPVPPCPHWPVCFTTKGCLAALGWSSAEIRALAALDALAAAGGSMTRLKADAYLHAHGKPLRALADAHPSQVALPDFGCTYRERLLAVEREIAWQRTARTEVG